MRYNKENQEVKSCCFEILVKLSKRQQDFCQKEKGNKE